MIKNLFFTTIIAILGTTSVSAQGYQGVVRELEQSNGGDITVTLDQQSSSVLSMRAGNSSISGYRICLFSGTDQNARSRANEVIGQLKEQFPGITSRWQYDAPVFKVYCGAWLNRIEAMIALTKLRNTFQSAYIVGEKFDIAELLPAVVESLPTDGSEPTNADDNK